jgi:hypothetical protein
MRQVHSEAHVQRMCELKNRRSVREKGQCGPDC